MLNSGVFIFTIRSVHAFGRHAGRPVELRSSPSASVSSWLRVDPVAFVVF